MSRITRRLAVPVLVAVVTLGAVAGSAGASTKPAGGSLCTAVKKYVAVVTKGRDSVDAALAERYAKESGKILKKIKAEVPTRFADEVELLRAAYKRAETAESVKEYLDGFSLPEIQASQVLSKYLVKRCKLG